MAGTNQAMNLTGMLNQIGQQLGKERDISGLTRNIENTFRPTIDTSTSKGMLEAAAYEAKMGRPQESAAYTAIASQQDAQAADALEKAQLLRDRTAFDALSGDINRVNKELNAPTQGVITRGDFRGAQQMLTDFQAKNRGFVGPGASAEVKEAYNAGVDTLTKGVESARKTNVDKTAAGLVDLQRRLADPNDPLSQNPTAAAAVKKHIEGVRRGRPEVLERMNEMEQGIAQTEVSKRNAKSAMDAAAVEPITGRYAAGKISHEKARELLAEAAEKGNTQAQAELEAIDKIFESRGKMAAATMTVETAPALVNGYEAQIKSLKEAGVQVGLFETQLEKLRKQAKPGMAEVGAETFRNDAQRLENALTQAMLFEDRKRRAEERKEEDKLEAAERSIVNRVYSYDQEKFFLADIQAQYGSLLESGTFGIGGDDLFYEVTKSSDGSERVDSSIPEEDANAMMRDRDRVMEGLEAKTFAIDPNTMLPIYNPETKEFLMVGESLTPPEKSFDDMWNNNS